MKKLLFVLALLFLNFQMFPQLNQGDVLINSFDPFVGGDYRHEFVVLVNHTDSTIDLNGYEIRCFDFEGEKVRPLWQWDYSQTIEPYGFFLVTVNIDSVFGVPADLVNDTDLDRGKIDFDGYLTFRKINASDSSEYIDIVKFNSFSNSGYPFSGVPEYSGITLSMPAFVLDMPIYTPPGEYATRGGVSGNLNSLNYSNYGMVGQTVSDFSIGTEGDDTYVQNASSAPLPVELSSFSAVVISNQQIQLKWRTETEVSNYGFEVHRQTIGNTEWTKIGFVEGNGNSNSPKNYSFIDGNLFNGSRFKYRLKQIDTDGEFEFSNIIEVDLDAPVKFGLSQNYPNPFNPSTTISFEIQKESNVNLSIYNELGELITTLVNEHLNPGYYQYKFDASNLASGFYLYRIQANDPSSNSGQSFVETKKMILMK